ncbi:AbrB family transcriptional regulator [Halomonas eurihalina]|uniref:AbrB family transcriptional regulator n=1 Tax=Halomonas eurihalina TaxID=42566 RepID=A0A5D9D7W9_HALER|nr:AbrB family transcriptional regulator [Halomonas eurihalina]MDR5860714.1 AbrB family transcriptional regulator [Halomonas eurihalina]TZG40064.1 AbrB family transcriptional regulator [Halomonas eurihalina]
MPTALPALLRFLPTLALGIVGGALAFAVNLPLPWLLGAMIATTAASLSGVRLRSPGRGRKGVLVVIGVMLGTAFTPGMTGDLGLWSLSLAVMLVATAVMMAFSVWFSQRVAGHSRETALYAGVPGGVSTVTLMAMASGADLRVVGMTHAVRILVLLLAIPPVLQAIGHVDLAGATPDLAQWLWLPGAADAAWLAVAGLGGLWLGRRLRLPNALLFGPALASAALHLTGVTHAAVPPTLLALAQVIIGVSVGVRFAGTSLARLGQTLVMATLQALVLLVIAVLAAWIGHLLTGYSAAAALLAYMPGGAPELSLVALTLGIDPAFVTTHHLMRISVLVLLLPALLRMMAGRA